MGLTPKQARFVKEYLVDLNAKQAAIRAGYTVKTAESQGSRLLAYAKVSKAVQEAQAKRLNKLEITAERVLAELARIGFSDPRELFDADGQMKPIQDLPDDTARCIASVEVTRETTRRNGDKTETETVTKIKHWDKNRALELLAKNLGLLKDRIQFEGIPSFRVVRDDSGR